MGRKATVISGDEKSPVRLDYPAIGVQIRSYRKKQKMTQKTLAEKSGISVQHLSHIECGSTKLSLTALVGLAVAKWDTLVAHENPVGWLYVAAGYCIFDEYARQHPEDVIFVPLENCQEIEHRDSEPLAIVIQDLLDGLTDKEKVVTVQYYFLGYSIKEISENLHISQGTVKKRMQRARDRIRERNKDEEKI